MSRRLIDCFHSILLAISIVAMVPIPSSASDPLLDHSMVPITDFPSHRSTGRPSQCCPVGNASVFSGATACGFNVTGGTHDSAPLYRIASVPQADSRLPVQAGGHDASKVMPAEVSIGNVIMAVASVRVQQVIEPFAVVGPSVTPSRRSITEFLDWCNQFAPSSAADPMPPVAVDSLSHSLIDQMISMDRMLDSLAAEEPVDVDANHVEVRNFVEQIRRIDNEVFVSVEKLDPLVGGSAMIATLGSGPYAAELGQDDIAESGQLKVWSVFPTVTRPFCIRHSTRNCAADHLSFAVAAADNKPVAVDTDRTSDLSLIGDIDSMLAQARSTASLELRIASNQARVNAIVESASVTVLAARKVGAWMIRQQQTATEQAIQRAGQLIGQVSMVDPAWTSSFQDLGSQVVDWSLTGQKLASSAAMTVAKALPRGEQPAAQENAAAKMAAAEASLNR
jgi:hypothetical protein